MSNQVQFPVFNFNSSQVRVIVDPNQEPWFCGSDVCSILGYVNAPDAMKKHCKEAGIAKRYISHSSGRKEAIFINEPNLYRLIIKSRKPEAEKFEAWVFEEVLPQIRKTGKYQVQQQLTLPQPEKKFTIELTEGEMMDLAWVWFAYVRSVHAFREIQQPLKSLGSKFSPIVYGLAYEYTVTARNAHRVINRITKDIPFDTESNWRVVKHIKNYNPKGNNSHVI